MVINGVNFDNTLSVKRQAEIIEASGLLDKILIKERGNQKQQFSIGDRVEGNGFTNATITDTWKENGFQRYEVEYKLGRKTYTKNVKQDSIQPLQ